MVRLKVYLGMGLAFTEGYFNSKMVRLKAKQLQRKR